jgi:hypothetical protein
MCNIILVLCGKVKQLQQLRRFAPPPYIAMTEGRGITADSVTYKVTTTQAAKMKEGKLGVPASASRKASKTGCPFLRDVEM